jgi:hypothetical protein
LLHGRLRQTRSSGKEAAALDQLIAEIIVDAYGDGEQLWACREAFEQNVDLPCDGFVIGEPVSVTAFDYDGNPRRGRPTAAWDTIGQASWRVQR